MKQGPKVRTKVLEGTFARVVQRIGPIIIDKKGEVLRVQVIVTMVDGGFRTAHLRQIPGGKWMMCLLSDEGVMQVGEVSYDGK